MGRRLLWVAPKLVAVLVISGVALVLSACGGGDSAQQDAKGHPLPQNPGALRPGEYHSVVFKPSLSFHVGKGWANTKSQLPDSIEVSEVKHQEETGWINIVNVKEVFKPGTSTAVGAPKDLVGWFQRHPYLKTDKPEPVTVGGVKGMEFDVAVAGDLPADHKSPCGTDCIDIFRQTTGDLPVYVGDKIHAIVLEDVKGKTVYIDYGGLASAFDKVAPEAQRLVDSVKWTGS